MDSLSVVSLITAMVGVLTSTVVGLLIRRQQGTTAETTVEQRIDRLTTTLNEAARTMQQIETEMNERRHLADQLRNDVETYNRLKELNQEQIEAITQVVEDAATSEARRSFYGGIVVNFGFFVLGAVVSVVTTLLLGS